MRTKISKPKNRLPRRRRLGRFIVADPEVCHGKLTFDGTRILVRTILAYLASGKSVEWVLTQWPELPREAVEEAMRLAANALVVRYDGFEIA
jgi:uncharacterized protein (DUF433 family)